MLFVIGAGLPFYFTLATAYAVTVVGVEASIGGVVAGKSCSVGLYFICYWSSD